MSRGESEQDEGDGAEPSRAPGAPDPPQLRRRPFGYRKADVDRALDARDTELTELKQDIAALWLAFSQHDRMIRALGGEVPRVTAAVEREPAPQAVEPSVEQEGVESGAESIGEPLTELDEVLAAIEMATRTLEDTYADEIEASRTGAPGDDEAGEVAADSSPGPEDEAEADSERS